MHTAMNFQVDNIISWHINSLLLPFLERKCIVTFVTYQQSFHSGKKINVYWICSTTFHSIVCKLFHHTHTNILLLHMSRMEYKVNLKTEFYKFELGVFFFPRAAAIPRLKSQPALLSTNALTKGMNPYLL